MKSIFALVLAALICGCSANIADENTPSGSMTELPSGKSADSLCRQIHDIIRGKKSEIGVAILGLKKGDTLTVNGDKDFAMMSVAKFPQALFVLYKVEQGELSLDQKVEFTHAELNANVFSSMKDSLKQRRTLSLYDVLRYSASHSDNITFDKLFEIAGGPEETEKYVRNLGINGITIKTGYAKMNTMPATQNRSTPHDIVRLLGKFYQRQILSDSSHQILWKLLTETPTGPDRIKGMLPAGTVVGHKTGTMGNEKGKFAAYNDAGIVLVPGGNDFAIAVFINDSNEDEKTNARVIAEISRAAYDHFTNGQ